jgi:hypothetical protein
VIAVRKVVPSLTAAMPGWLLVICGACLAIPLAPAGYIDSHGCFVPGAARESPSCGECVEGRMLRTGWLVMRRITWGAAVGRVVTLPGKLSTTNP